MDFYDKEITKPGSNHTGLAIIILHSALKQEENYYLQVFLKQYKYIEKKVVSHIIDELESSLMILIILITLMKKKLKI